MEEVKREMGGTFLRPAVSNTGMASVRHLLCLMLVVSTWGLSQAGDSSDEREETLQKTAADRKLDKDDVQCGNYLWMSTKTGTKFLYYFFGSTEWGKGKVGFYQQKLYRVVVNADQETPTVQRLKDSTGSVSEVRIQMTGRELAASSACLSER